MTPEIITAAVVAALLLAVKTSQADGVRRAAADGYELLKECIHVKFGHRIALALAELEAEPASDIRRLVFAASLAQVNAHDDPELIAVANTLLSTVRALLTPTEEIHAQADTSLTRSGNVSIPLSIIEILYKEERQSTLFTGIFGGLQATPAPLSSAPPVPIRPAVVQSAPGGSTEFTGDGLTQLLRTLDSTPVPKYTNNTSIVRVFYATDRMQTPSFTNVRYDKRRSLFGKIHYGECEVSIPKSHRMGKLETPSLLRLEFRPNPDKHIVLNKTTILPAEGFLQQIRASVDKSARKEAFVFIHGYNVSFEDAARRTGQIAFDLNFIGAPIFYSWPSNSRVADYIKDETNITWSFPHFEAFLQMLSRHSGAERIHVIAHSMGNRAVCEALKNISRDASTRFKLNHLVLAAPDIDADTFTELADTLIKLSDRVTLYESSQDKAIQASKRIHGHSRAGEPLLVLPGLDTIDASGVDTNFLGHSYFSDNWPLLSDIHSTISGDVAPSGRFGLTEIKHTAGQYYVFRQ